MLELDILLDLFATDVYESLSEKEKLNFIDLLALPDPLLFSWLLGKETPAPAFLNIINQIRQHAKSKFSI